MFLPLLAFRMTSANYDYRLVAILLGRLRMSVEEAIQAVEEMASVGAKPKRRKSLRSGFRVRKQPADTEKLMRSLAPYLSEREIIPGLRLLQSKFSVPDEYMCKWYYYRTKNEPLLTSHSVTFKYATGAYEFQKSYGASTSESLEIEEAARETLSNAAPRKASGAPPKSRSNSTRTLSITTERVLVLYQEINKNLRQQTTFTESQVGDRSLQGTHQTSNAPGFLLVSIGPDDVSIGPDDVSIMADDSVGVAGGFNHTRIPEPPELARFIPNEWKLGCSHRKLQEIKEQAISHCESKPIKERLRDCARNLVYTRQQRAQTRRWERFAFGTHYNCQFCDNAGTKPEYIGDQYGLIEHLQRVHDAPPPDVSYYDDYMEILKNFRTRA